jgi:hypothetical protein
LDTFIRAMIFSDRVMLYHVKNGMLLHAAELSSRESVFAYLKENAVIPVEVVVHDDVMACQLIPAANLRSRDIKALATNLLAERSEVNTLFYEERTRNSRDNITMCGVMMKPDALAFLCKLLTVRNLILSVSCWPLWIARHYCDMYQSDVHKFAVLLLMGEHDRSWEIVVVRNGDCICYRSGDIGNFDRTVEIEDTLAYINKTLNVSPNDVMIYTITNDVIPGITKASSVYMSVISRNVEISIARYSRVVDKVIKLGCYFMTLVAFVCSVVNVSDALSYQGKLAEARVTLASIDKNIVDEACLWKSLGNVHYGNAVDFQEILLKHVPDSKILRNASVAVGTNADDIKVNIILET